MKAVRFHQFGGREVLRLDDAELAKVHEEAAAGSLHGKVIIEIEPTEETTR